MSDAPLPEKLVLRGGLWALVAIGGVILGALTLMFYGAFVTRALETDMVVMLMGFLGAALLGLPLYAARVLVISHKGFAVGTMVRKTRYRWEDVSAFHISPGRMAKRVLFGPNGMSEDRINKLMGDLSPPHPPILDTYGMPREELVDILNVYRTEAITRGRVSSSDKDG